MIWKIAKKEFLLNLMTFKFTVGTILCVVLTAAFTPVLVRDYEQRLKDYNKNVADTESELQDNTEVYLSLSIFRVYRLPVILSVFSKGVENQIANSPRIMAQRIPEINANSLSVNSYLSILPALDISLIFKIIISVLALLMACDVISGEREQGTLKLILSGTVARHQVLLGKLLAGQLTLLVPVTAAFLVALLVLLLSPMIELAASDWAQIGLMYLTSLVFISAMYNVGLLVSCLTKKSTTSLVVGLFIWVVFIIIVPHTSACVATQIAPLEPWRKVESQLTEVVQQRANEIEVLEKLPYSKGKYDSVYIKYAQKLWEIKHRRVETLFRQKTLADNLSRTSLISVYQDVMSALSGTDAIRMQSFFDRAREYRNEVIEYLEYLRSNTDTHSRQDFPLFIYRPDIMNDLSRAIPGLSILILANILFFSLSFVRFLKYDVR